MTDERGLIQFAQGEKPDTRSGYTIDDNARAFIVALIWEDETGRELAGRYAGFLCRAQREDGTWCNWWLPERGFVTDLDSDDSLGRAFLASCLGAVRGEGEVQENSCRMLKKALPAVERLRYPRGIAYAVIAGSLLAKGMPDLRECGYQIAAELGDGLASLYLQNREPGWWWFEDALTYCNGVLPQALFAYYEVKAEKRVLAMAEDSLRFLGDAVFARGYLTPVGNRGWWARGGSMPLFDQQPVEACSMVLACLFAHRVTGKIEYKEMAAMAHAWYFGKNIQGLSLYNRDTGGCHDALTPEGLNLNQGAEAVVSMLMSCQAVANIDER